MLFLLLLFCFLGFQDSPEKTTPQQEPAQNSNRIVMPFTRMAKPPKLPKVDRDACPFEGCQFGKWTARSVVNVYSTWSASRQRIARLSTGQVVTALTGINIVHRPSKGRFTRDVAMFGAKAGDWLYSYRYCGEGAEDVWVRGRFFKCVDPNFSWKRGEGCQRDCNGRYLALAKSDWWVQIRFGVGRTGWVLGKQNFQGTDAFE